MHQSVRGGCPGWPDMVAGRGESRVAHSHPIPKPTSAEPLGSLFSLLVNKVTSLLPGIAVRKGISHRRTMLTNNSHHGHLRKVPNPCGHTAAQTLGRNVHARCWEQHQPGRPLRPRAEESLVPKFQAQMARSVWRILPQSHNVVANSCICPNP